MMILMWGLILSPSEAVFEAIAAMRWHRDRMLLVEWVSFHRLKLLQNGAAGTMHLEQLCHDIIPYSRCVWRGLGAGPLHFYQNSSRFSPGHLNIVVRGVCHQLVVSSYGLVRINNCDHAAV